MSKRKKNKANKRKSKVQTETEPRFALVHYDVPTGGSRSPSPAYAEIRDALRGESVPLSGSVYLIPFAMMGRVTKALKPIAKKHGVNFGVLIQDHRENTTVRSMVNMAIQRMTTSAIAQFRRSMARAEEKVADGKYVDLNARRKQAEKAAERLIHEANKAATCFEVKEIKKKGERTFRPRQHGLESKAAKALLKEANDSFDLFTQHGRIADLLAAQSTMLKAHVKDAEARAEAALQEA